MTEQAIPSTPTATASTISQARETAAWLAGLRSEQLLTLLVVGMFLDSTTAILVIAPIIAKPLIAAGVDPVHLGMVVVFNLMIGLVTPPMGLSLYLVADIAKVKMKEVLREMLPFYIPLVITLLLITYVPWITTSVPQYFVGR